MGGSENGKRSKGKGKSKQTKSDKVGEKPKKNPKLDLRQASSKNIDFSKTIPYVESELEEFLYVKIDGLYKTAREWLLRSGYSTAEVEMAILNAGHIHDRMDLLNNIVTNLIGFLEKDIKPVGEAFKNIYELYRTVLEVLVDCTMQNHPDMNRPKAMWHLVVTRWDHVSSAAETSRPQSSRSSSHSENGDEDEDDDDGVIETFAAAKLLYDLNFDSLSKKVGVSVTTNQVAATKRDIGAPIIPDGKTFENPDCALVDSALVDPLKEIRELQEEVKKQKDWAQGKVMDSTKRSSEHFSELLKLRMDKNDREKIKNGKNCLEMSMKLLEAEQSLEKANSEASHVNDAVKKMKIENDEIRAEIAAFKLNASESESELKQILKRNERYTKKLADVEKQTSILRLQCDEEKQRAVQLEQELFQAEKETGETETKWKEKIKEKEEMLALLAQETKNAKTQKAHSRAQLQKLHQQVETDSRQANDKCQRLQNELSQLRESQSRPIEELFPENLDFLYRYDEATSSESSAPCEPSHWICMICMQNEVSVLFLPCTHQVVCFPCYVKKGQAVGAFCPYCGVGIKDAVKVYGSSS